MYKTHAVLVLQIEDETQVSRATQAEQDHYEMHVRAANIVSMPTVVLIGERLQMSCGICGYIHFKSS